MDTEKNKDLVRRYMEMWNTGNVKLVDEVLAPNWRDHAHPELTGLEDVKRVVSERRATLPDLHITIESIVSEGDMVALRGIILSTQQGKEAVSHVMWFIRIANGQMIEMWTGSELSG